jgi:hypothetical protein
MLVFSENPESFLDDFSKEFEKVYMDLVSRRWKTKRVNANKVHICCTCSYVPSVNLGHVGLQRADPRQTSYSHELYQVGDSCRVRCPSW